MSAHTRKHPTKSGAWLKKEIRAKLARLTNAEDLDVLNKVIDKYLPNPERSVSPEEIWGDEWTDPVKQLSRLIRGYRLRDNISQLELAKKLKGLKQSNISAWETGKEKVPPKRIKQLSRIFKINLEKMIE